MPVVFAVEDVFTVGLGFDIGGAYLLARGLLAPPPLLASRTASMYGSNAYAVVSQAEDRIRGAFGLGSLVFGFTLQALGYALVLGGEGTTSFSTSRGVLALALAAVPVALVVLTERLARPQLRRRLLVDVARFDVSTQQMNERPSAAVLVDFGGVLGDSRRDGEEPQEYVERVWRVGRQ